MALHAVISFSLFVLSVNFACHCAFYMDDPISRYNLTIHTHSVFNTRFEQSKLHSIPSSFIPKKISNLIIISFFASQTIIQAIEMSGVRATYICWNCNHEYLKFNTRAGVIVKCPRCRTENAPGYEVTNKLSFSSPRGNENIFS